MVSQQRREATRSINLTINVVAVVHRLKSRVSGLSTDRSLLGSNSCLRLEPKTVRGLQKGLGRVPSHGQKQLQQSLNRVRKRRKVDRHSLNLQVSSKRDLQEYVELRALSYRLYGSLLTKFSSVFRALDSISPPGNALSAVCSDNKLFLQSGILNFEACTFEEAVHLLILVHRGIKVLDAVRAQFDDTFLIALGKEIDLNIDEIFIANYEHLLLWLQGQLLETLTRKVIEALIVSGFDKTQHKLLDWFSEFPDNHRPLSTTWPWSIKPSLAVIWG